MTLVKSKSLQVCIIIPAFNESTVIGNVISDLFTTFKKSSFRPTVIVINDGSTDNTSTVARESGAVVIDHILNSGAGSATATGLSYAEQQGFDIAATMDADGQHSSGDVLNGIKSLAKSDIDLLIGSRLIDNKGMSRVKVLGNRGLSIITYALFGINSTDSQSGLRVFSRHALQNLRWKTNGYEFCSEMLWRAKQQQMKIDEFPIKAIYTSYSKAKGQNNWNGINIVKTLVLRRVAELFG